MRDDIFGAFELFEKGNKRSPQMEVWAEPHEKEELVEYLFRMLDQTPFQASADRDRAKASLQAFLTSLSLPRGELLMGFEVLYHLRSWAEGGYQKRDFMKSSL